MVQLTAKLFGLGLAGNSGNSKCKGSKSVEVIARTIIPEIVTDSETNNVVKPPSRQQHSPSEWWQSDRNSCLSAVRSLWSVSQDSNMLGML